MHPKITPEHLGRGAVIYIRQSTIGQVVEHTESQRRQYALADSARAFGFASVTVIPRPIPRLADRDPRYRECLFAPPPASPARKPPLQDAESRSRSVPLI